MYGRTSQLAAKQCALVAASGGWICASLDDPQNGQIITLSEENRQRSISAPSAANSSPMMSPILPIRVIRPNSNLEIAFDVRTRNAIYVLEKLDRAGQNLGKDHKRPHFFEEKLIPQEAYRSRPSHYRNSGYDRGHLAPAADFPLQTQDTYNLCNTSPQNHSMNLSIWSQIEEFTRRVADRDVDYNTYVVTGPLWLPSKQLTETKFEYSYYGLGRPPSLVAVPTHFFKVVAVICPRSSAILRFACFVVTNAEPDKSKKIQDYVVPWTDLEAVTGLQFFPGVATTEWKKVADHLTHDSVMRFTSKRHQKLLENIFSSSKRKVAKSRPPENLQHLCKGGECR